MTQSLSAMGRRAGKRPKVAVVYDDVTLGFRYADWFAQQGYQATLASGAHQPELNLRELGPDVIVVDFSSPPTRLSRTVPRLKTTCPQVPIIAMVDLSTDLRTGADPDISTPFGDDVFLCRSLDPSPTEPAPR